MVRIAFALLVVALTVSCSRPAERDERERAQEPRHDPPSGPDEVWSQVCARCHTEEELEGRSVENIRVAMKTVSTMRRFQSQVSEADIEGIARMLEREPTGGGESDGRYAYRGSAECRRCHPDQVAEWAPSLHALAHFETIYDRYFIKASLETDQTIETFCAGCHTPLAVLNKNIPFAKAPQGPGDTTVNAVEAEGVQCEFCHTITGYKSVENGHYTLRPSSKLLGPLENASSTFHEAEFSKLYRQPEYCGICHNVTHPTNGIVLESTYSEWREGPYAQEGIICQDCHMTDGISRRQVNPGKAATKGPSRGHVSRHFFVGPNIIFSDAPGADQLRERSMKLLQGAGELTIGEPERRGTELRIPIEVANKRAGHYLPTGVTEIRELWLEVLVTDGAGATIYHEGALDEQGDLDAKAIVYRTEVVDSEGNVTTKFWNAVKKLRDHRIPPRGSLTEHIVVPLDGSAAKASSLNIKAYLRYRSVSPSGLAEVGAPRDLVEIPVITIAEAAREAAP